MQPQSPRLDHALGLAVPGVGGLAMVVQVGAEPCQHRFDGVAPAFALGVLRVGEGVGHVFFFRRNVYWDPWLFPRASAAQMGPEVPKSSGWRGRNSATLAPLGTSSRTSATVATCRVLARGGDVVRPRVAKRDVGQRVATGGNGTEGACTAVYRACTAIDRRTPVQKIAVSSPPGPFVPRCAAMYRDIPHPLETSLLRVRPRARVRA